MRACGAYMHCDEVVGLGVARVSVVATHPINEV
jgi:hypothetical protein